MRKTNGIKPTTNKILLTLLLITISTQQAKGESLLVEVTGLPSNKEAEVWIVNSESRQKLTANPSTSKAKVTQLSPGKYVITPLSVSAESSMYIPASFDPTNIINITSGENPTVTIRYEQAGHLQLSTSNLPPNLPGKLTVIGGPKGKFTVCPSEGAILNLPLLPGRYIITPNVVSDGKAAYEAPRSRVTLNSGDKVNLIIEYEESKTTDPKTINSSGC